MFRQLQKQGSSSTASLLFQKQMLLQRPVTQFSTQAMHSRSPSSSIDLDQAEEIARRQRAIFMKTEQGRGLVQSVADRKPFDKFEREQRYEIFVNKMIALEKSERKFTKKANKVYKKMQFSPMISQTPVKLVLSEYNKLTNRGFDCQVLANSLKYLSTTIRSRGNDPKVYADYSLSEMDQSWKFDKVAQDIKFGLENDTQFFSPKNMARVSRHLGDINYKNTELISTWFDKLDRMLAGKEDLEQKLTMEQAVFGGMKNFTPRHYIFKGFEQDEEFGDHLNTLINWQHENRLSRWRPSEGAKQSKKAKRLEAKIHKLKVATKEIKEIQTDQQAAIDTLRTQYFKLQEAHDTYDFLSGNDYVRLELAELQELLIKGGYLDPNEVLNFDAKESLDLEKRIEKASQVFYDNLQNFHPELLSTQHQQFIDAFAEADAVKQKYPLQIEETHNKVGLETLSSVLVGLEQQALSFRRDAVDKDYPNEFYKRFLLKDEEHLDGKEHRREENILMERSYLNAWTTFQKRVKDVMPYFDELVKNNPDDVLGQLRSFRALSACKYEKAALREEMINNLNRATKQQKKNFETTTPVQPLIDGLVGLAECEFVPNRTYQLYVNFIYPVLAAQVKQLSFEQVVDILYALSILDFQDVKQRLNNQLIQQLDDLTYAHAQNELRYETYQKLYDVNQYFQLKGQYRFENKQLRMALEQKDQEITMRYIQEELFSSYDPIKPRLVAGLVDSLAKSNFDQVHLAQNEDVDVINQDQFGYKPDILVGYKGRKVGLFVLNSRNVMADSQRADGRTAFKMRLNDLKHMKADQKNKVSVALPIDSVLDYDLQSYKMKLNEKFNLHEFLVKETGLLDAKYSPVSYLKLIEFASNISNVMIKDKNSIANSGNMDHFLLQIFHVLQQKDKLESQTFDQFQVDSKRNDLKYEVMKLQMMHQVRLSDFEKQLVKDSLPNQTESFDQLIDSLRKQLINQQQTNNQKIDDRLDLKWLGTRQEVELPVDQKFADGHRKSVVPELLNRQFLNYDSYHQYNDWKTEMEEVYDQFNMLQIPHNSDDPKFYFDPQSHKRIIPKGVFPWPNHKRLVLEKPSQLGYSGLTDREINNRSDRFTKFEKDPLKYMLDQEFEKSKTLKDISQDVSFITNLQNVKQGLKADYTDDQIGQVLFGNLKFTDQLIQKHLNDLDHSEEAKEPTFVKRCLKSFRSFFARQDGFDSPFNHFYLKEALKQNKAKELFDQIEDEYLVNEKERDYDKIRSLETQMEDILIRNNRENEDNFNLGKALDNWIQIDYDLKSLGINKDRSLAKIQDSTVSDQDFLNRERCRAESKLIKSAIIYKMNQDIELNELENKYLQKWMIRAKNPKSIARDEDVMVPKIPSNFSIGDLSAEDLFTLNSISRVDLTREAHGDYALNDLVLELSHFIDPQAIRKVELSCLEKSLQKSWNLGKEFKIVNQRNKEIDLVLQELEELAWRTSGQFDNTDATNITNMVGITRGVTKIDKTFWDMDQKSLNEFLQDVNGCDKRIELLESWLVRKEREIKTRVNMPTPDLIKSDAQVNKLIEKQFKPARQNLVSQMLVNDQFGNKISEKDYKDLTSDELHQLAEGLVVRLNLFDREYPAFVPQVIRGVMEHENLQNSDRLMLETYCNLFELDWRGDRTVANREQFLASNPIYHKDQTQVKQTVDAKLVKEMLQRACVPFLPHLTDQLLSAAESHK